jgi:DNA-binding beta-propeller fold protein YncE
VPAIVLFALLAGCAGPSSHNDIAYVSGTSPALVALIDAAFVASLPTENGQQAFDELSPVSACLRPDDALIVSDAASGQIIAIPLASGAPHQVETATIHLDQPGIVRSDALGNVYAADGTTRQVEVIDARFRARGEILPPYEALGLAPGRISGMAFGPSGQFYACDPINGRVYRFDASGHFVDSFTGGEQVGWGQLSQPQGMACTADGTELYVCDPAKRQITVFDPTGTPLRAFGATDLKEPWAVALNRRGQVFVADRAGKAVCVFDSQGRLLDRIVRPTGGDWEAPSDILLRDSSLCVTDPGAGQVIIMRLRGAGTE